MNTDASTQDPAAALQAFVGNLEQAAQALFGLVLAVAFIGFLLTAYSSRRAAAGRRR